MRRYIYVDTENVSTSAWFNDISKLSSNDTLLLFYTERSANIKLTMDDLNLLSIKCKIICCRVSAVGRNSLDFVLVTELGRYAYLAKKAKHYIISHDSGFMSSILHLRNMVDGLCVNMRNTLSDCLEQERDSVEE